MSIVSRILASRNPLVTYLRDLAGQTFSVFMVAFFGLLTLSTVTDFSSLRNVVVAAFLAGVRAVIGMFARPFGHSTSAHFTKRFR